MLQRAPVQRLDASFVLALIFAAGPRRPWADYASVRAKPLAKAVRHGSVTAELEVEFIRAYHEDGDLDALERLVEGHRPMVVRLARRFAQGNPRKLEAFVEYGMLGLIEAAAPPRPSLTKKGQLVGFDPSKYRFSTYARSYAEKAMRTATPDWEPPQHVIDSKMEFDAWAKTPIPAEIEEAVEEVEDSPPSFAREMTEVNFGKHQFHDMWRDERQAPAQRPVDPTRRFQQIRYWRGMFGITSVLDYDDDAMLLQRKPRPRRTRKTDAEYAATDRYYAGYWGKLHSFKFVAREGMEGWGDEDELHPIESDQAEFMVATLFRNHALKGDLYRVPKKVLHQRWKIGCKREGKKVPYKFNKGLGIFDRNGHWLQDYAILDGKVTVKRHRPFIPFLSASIYLTRRGIRQYLILLAAGRYI